MGSNTLEQRSRFALIGTLMIIIGLLFLFYMGRSMVTTTQKYMKQSHRIEVNRSF